MRNNASSFKSRDFSGRWLLAIAVLLLPLAAQAYVGPGAGLSLLNALWGVVAAIGAAFLFLIMWPIRRMRRLRREKQQAEANPGAATTAARSDHSEQQTPSGSGSAQPHDTQDNTRVSDHGNRPSQG